MPHRNEEDQVGSGEVLVGPCGEVTRRIFGRPDADETGALPVRV